MNDPSLYEISTEAGFDECYTPIDRPVSHHRAPKWVWDETFNKPDGRTFRVSRIPSDENDVLREEIVHERNLGACVADLANTAKVCSVLVYEVDE